MKKKLGLVGGIIVLGIIGAATMTSNTKTAQATDSPLVTEVQQQQDELANHEARITNTESNVKALQDSTNIPSSPTQVVVPATPAPTQTSTSPVVIPPVTVVSYQIISVDSNTTDCLLTYSDGTTYQWHWEVINPQGSWITDSSGQNGHWVTTTSATNKCDDSVIGNLKSN